MLARLRLLALALVAVVAIPVVAAAQQPASTRATAGPRQAVTATAIKRPTQARTDSLTLVQRRSQSMGKPVALMVVGGAAVVLGAVIGDDVGTIFMIGGAVALLIGLYQYLQ